MSTAADVIAERAMRPARPQTASIKSAWWLIGWALAALILIAGFGAAAARLDFNEPDSTMRLVEVRDFLSGQGWFDMTQHRLDPAHGVVSHWARWIDAAIALPIMPLAPLVGQHNAEVATAFLWPLALLAVFMWLVSRVCAELAGDKLRRESAIAGPIVAALAFPTIEKFAPGGLDHHNVELVLAFAAMLGLMRMSVAPRMGALAGIALGAAMATAAEGVPQLAAGTLIAGLMWLLRPAAYRRGLAWFGASLASSTLIFFLMLVPPQNWGVHLSDSMSLTYLILGLAAGACAMALGFGAWSDTASLSRRLIIAALAAGIALAALLLICPELAGGGYAALSPDMKTLWLPQVSETRSLLQAASDNLSLAMGAAGTAFAALVTAAIYLRTRWREANGWIVLAFLFAGLAVLAWQIRGAAFAGAFAIPFGARAIIVARRQWQAARGPRGLLLFAAISAVSLAAAWQAAGAQLQARLAPPAAMASYDTRRASADACLTREAFAPLNAVKPGLILNPFVTGPVALLSTHHAVIAGPYHRNGQGITTMMTAMRATPDAARPIVEGSGADYVLVCPALPETSWYAQHPLDAQGDPKATLSAKLGKGEAPAWLQRVDLGDTPLQLYRVVR
jgi:hypothetical protein